MIIEALRIIFGSFFVLFLPGFSLSYAFFKKKEIDMIERVALSFGLSIAVVPLLVFYFNWLFGIKINALNSGIIILAVTAVGAAIYYYKEGKFSGRKKESQYMYSDIKKL